MDRKELQEIRTRVWNTAELLYQNKADGVNEIAALLPLIQQVGNVCVEIDANLQLQILQILRKLIEGCQTTDVLQLADTLYYEAIALVDFSIARGEQ